MLFFIFIFAVLVSLSSTLMVANNSPSSFQAVFYCTFLIIMSLKTVLTVKKKKKIAVSFALYFIDTTFNGPNNLKND